MYHHFIVTISTFQSMCFLGFVYSSVCVSFGFYDSRFIFPFWRVCGDVVLFCVLSREQQSAKDCVAAHDIEILTTGMECLNAYKSQQRFAIHLCEYIKLWSRIYGMSKWFTPHARTHTHAYKQPTHVNTFTLDMSFSLLLLLSSRC